MASESAVIAAARAAGFVQGDMGMAVSLAWAESEYNANAVGPTNSNGTRDYGAWQINSAHKTEPGFEALNNGKWKDLNENAKMAKRVKDTQGWNWSSIGNAKQEKKFQELTKFGGLLEPNVSNTDEAVEEDPIGSAGSQLPWADATNSIVGVINFLTDPAAWERIVKVVAGGALAVVALALVVKAGK